MPKERDNLRQDQAQLDRLTVLIMGLSAAGAAIYLALRAFHPDLSPPSENSIVAATRTPKSVSPPIDRVRTRRQYTTHLGIPPSPSPSLTLEKGR